LRILADPKCWGEKELDAKRRISSIEMGTISLLEERGRDLEGLLLKRELSHQAKTTLLLGGNLGRNK